MEFKWTVNKLQVSEDNLVVVIDATVTAINGDNTASANYIRNLTRGVSFIPFDQLTEAQVLAWLFESVEKTWTDLDGNEQLFTYFLKDEGETQVAGQIARQLAQKAAEPALPWVKI